MNLSLFAFKFIDYTCDYIQNYKKYKNINRVTDIIYDNNYGDVCKLDILYDNKLIAEGAKLPVYMNIHGGGFIAGDKKHRRSFCSFIADLGFFVVNINHGLCPDYKFPYFLHHCVKALNWISDNATEYNLDLDNVFVGGDSAGGYISAMLGAMQANDELREKIEADSLKTKIKGLLLISGSYDMATLVSSKVPFKIAAQMGESITGMPLKKIHKNRAALEEYEYFRELYPETYINEKFPTSFIAHSTKDFFVPNQGDKFIELLKQHNIKYTEHKATRLVDIHCYPIFRYNKASKQCIKDMTKFLQDNLSS